MTEETVTVEDVEELQITEQQSFVENVKTIVETAVDSFKEFDSEELEDPETVVELVTSGFYGIAGEILELVEGSGVSSNKDGYLLIPRSAVSNEELVGLEEMNISSGLTQLFDDVNS